MYSSEKTFEEGGQRIMSVVLSAKNIQKTYKTSSGDVHALKGVSCDFEKGLFYNLRTSLCYSS